MKSGDRPAVRMATSPSLKKSGAAPKETPSLFKRKPVVEETKETEEVKETVNLNHESHGFTNDQLQKVWSHYRDKRKSERAGDMELLVLNREVKQVENDQVMITLASALEANILDKCEQEIVQYLRTSLSNYNILIQREVREQAMERKLYTSKDKFEYMAEINPILREMKERLGLDFEY